MKRIEKININSNTWSCQQVPQAHFATTLAIVANQWRQADMKLVIETRASGFTVLRPPVARANS